MKTGNEITDLFLAELDRRIESPDSPHDEASKIRLRAMRPLFHVIAKSNPDKLADVLVSTLDKMFGLKL